MPMNPPAIKAEKLTFERSGEYLFENFSFEIPKGSYVAIIGPNGSGKTTLLRILLNLAEPTAGSAELFGLPVSDPRSRRRIGYVPQRGGAIDENFPATAEEVVSAGRTQLGGLGRGFSSEDSKAVRRTFETLGIEPLRERIIASLSGGEIQRVLLARALSVDPDILALDEPVDGLDPESREEFYATMRKLKKSGKTILFVTHEVRLIAKEADSVICFRHKLFCHDNACFITGDTLRGSFHANKEDFIHHHG